MSLMMTGVELTRIKLTAGLLGVIILEAIGVVLAVHTQTRLPVNRSRLLANVLLCAFKVSDVALKL